MYVDVPFGPLFSYSQYFAVWISFVVYYLSHYASVALVLAGDVYSFPFATSCTKGHCKSQAFAISTIPVFLDCSVTVDGGLLKSITISVISAAAK